MNEDIRLETWSEQKERVRLTYTDGTVLYVQKADFNRAFGPIVAATKEEVIRDFT